MAQVSPMMTAGRLIVSKQEGASHKDEDLADV